MKPLAFTRLKGQTGCMPDFTHHFRRKLSHTEELYLSSTHPKISADSHKKRLVSISPFLNVLYHPGSRQGQVRKDYCLLSLYTVQRNSVSNIQTATRPSTYKSRKELKYKKRIKNKEHYSNGDYKLYQSNLIVFF